MIDARVGSAAPTHGARRAIARSDPANPWHAAAFSPHRAGSAPSRLYLAVGRRGEVALVGRDDSVASPCLLRDPHSDQMGHASCPSVRAMAWVSQWVPVCRTRGSQQFSSRGTPGVRLCWVTSLMQLPAAPARSAAGRMQTTWACVGRTAPWTCWSSKLEARILSLCIGPCSWAPVAPFGAWVWSLAWVLWGPGRRSWRRGSRESAESKPRALQGTAATRKAATETVAVSWTSAACMG